jgi:hypothetical protein
MVDVVSDQTEVSYAESVTGWSGDTFSLENEILVQNANSVACIQTANGVNDAIYSGSWDMTNSHIRMYMNSNISTNMDTDVNGGIQILLGDGTNTAIWNVGGKDSYAGGWKDYFISVESTPTSGTVNTAAVTTVTLRINTVTKPRNSTNGWYDNWRFGNGLEINSTTTEAINFTSVAVEDSLIANQYDILQNTDGVLFGKGKLTLGNAAAAKNCNLVSLNETIFFVDAVVAADLYGIVGTKGTGATDIDITGLVCKTVGTSGAELNFSAALTSFVMDGCTFIDMGTMQFNTGTVTNTKFNGCGTTSIAVTQTFTNDTWIASGQIDLNNGGKLTDCTVDSTTAASAVLTDDLADVTGCIFTSDGSSYAIDLGTVAASVTMNWDNTESDYVTGSSGTNVGVTPTGNETILVNVATSQTLTINIASGASIPSVANSGAGEVDVVAGQVTLGITVRDINDATLLENARVYVTAAAGGSLTVGTVIIDKALTNASGFISDTRSYASDQPIEGVVRFSTSPNFYKTAPISGTVDSASGLSLTVQMIKDA